MPKKKEEDTVELDLNKGNETEPVMEDTINIGDILGKLKGGTTKQQIEKAQKQAQNKLELMGLYVLLGVTFLLILCTALMVGAYGKGINKGIEMIQNPDTVCMDKEEFSHTICFYDENIINNGEEFRNGIVPQALVQYQRNKTKWG